MSKQKCLQRAARTPPWISTRRRLRMSKRPNNTRTPVASSAPLSSEAHPPASISIGARLAKVLFILNTRAGLDGILTCFALISSCAGAAIDARVVLVMGICNIFADALAMGLCQLRVSQWRKPCVSSARVVATYDETVGSVGRRWRVPLVEVVDRLCAARTQPRGMGVRKQPRGRGVARRPTTGRDSVGF